VLCEITSILNLNSTHFLVLSLAQSSPAEESVYSRLPSILNIGSISLAPQYLPRAHGRPKDQAKVSGFRGEMIVKGIGEAIMIDRRDSPDD